MSQKAQELLEIMSLIDSGMTEDEAIRKVQNG